jgi:DNA-binding SARP family transcriptional activator/tetratricopeptide (TPR) repeat protein
VNSLEIRLLGTFALRNAEGILHNLSERQQSLLAYLLLHGAEAQSRQQLAFLFWPESSDKQAKTNLRQLLYHLRQSWPDFDHYLDSSARTLQWRDDATYVLDVHHFQQLLEQATQAATPDVTCRLLEEGVNCYQGDLLPDCYDDWVEIPRAHLRQQVIKAQTMLIRAYEARGDYQTAIARAEAFLRYDTCDEETYRTLMRLHALTNNRAVALQVYHTCETVLREELGVEPSPATREQYKQLLESSVTAVPPAPVRAALSPSPLFGRAQEWNHLQRIWQTAQSAQAQILLIYGEAGIGKTRLLEEFSQWAMMQGAVTAQTRSYATQDQLTYAPVTAWLRSDTLRSRLATLDAVWLSEISRLLPELQAEYPMLSPPHPLTESWQRERFYEALARAVLNGADQHPLVLIIDDLQWSGEGVLAWFSYLLHFAADQPLLMIGTIRSGTIDADHPLQNWVTALRQEQRLTELRLHPLGADEAVQLANHIAGRPLSADQADALYRETEGNPFFIVETMRAALEMTSPHQSRQTALANVTAVALPPRVQAVIESRLNQLSTAARALADYAAVMGREFSFAVLARAQATEEEALVRALDELWQRRIVREQGTTAYDFSHDKIREVVYSGISRARRHLLHRRIAEALIAMHGENESGIAAQLAHHYEQAQMPERAIAYYQRAATVAQRVYANAEVIRLLTHALDLLHALPSSATRDREELSLRVARSAPLVALAGYNRPEVIAEYQAVLALCRKLGLPPDPRALRGLAIANILQANYRQSAAYGEQIIQLPQAQEDAVLRVEGHYVLGVSAFWRGDFAEARHHLEEALTHYNPAQRAIHINTYAQDPGIICLTRLAWTLWYLGYPDQAYAMMDRAVSQPTASSHPFSRAYALAFACMLYEDAEDPQRLQQQTTQLGELAAEANFFYLRNWAAFHQGWIVGLDGNYEESARQIRQVIDRWHAEQTYLLTPRMLERLAVAYQRSARLDQGAAILEEARAAALQRDETYFLAELLRMKGEFLLAQGGATTTVANCFEAAVTMARTQGARMLELRALVSLCRLWQAADQPGQLSNAHQALQQCYNWFTEGFAGADLQAAQILLAELAASSSPQTVADRP